MAATSPWVNRTLGEVEVRGAHGYLIVSFAAGLFVDPDFGPGVVMQNCSGVAVRGLRVEDASVGFVIDTCSDVELRKFRVNDVDGHGVEARASSDVNLLLVPEAPFTLAGVLSFLERRLARKSHAVVVVAEGAGRSSEHLA